MDALLDNLWMYVWPSCAQWEYRNLLILTMLPFPGVGAAYGTAKAGIGIAGVGTFRPDLIMKACYRILPAGLCEGTLC